MTLNQSGAFNKPFRRSPVNPDGSAPQLGLRSRIQYGFSWNLVATLFIQGSTFLVLLLFAHVLDRAEFGRFAIVQTTLLTTVALSQLATGYTATKYLAEFREADPLRAGRLASLCGAVSLTMAVLGGSALLLGADAIAVRLLRTPDLVTALRCAALAIPFLVLNGFLSGALAGLEEYRALGLVGVFAGIAYVALSSCGVLLWGVPGAVIGIGTSAFVQCVLLVHEVRCAFRKHSVPWIPTGAWRERAVIMRFALPAAVSGLSSMPALWLSNAFLVRQPTGLDQMALYSAANNLRAIVLVAPSILNTVMMSLMNQQKGTGDSRRYRRAYLTNIWVTGGVLIGCSVTMLVASPYVLRLFGKGFVAAYPVVVILMVAAVIEGLTIAAYLVMQSEELLWLGFVTVVLPRDILILFLAYWLCPLYGAKGLAIAYGAGWLVGLVGIGIIAWRLQLRATTGDGRHAIADTSLLEH